MTDHYRFVLLVDCKVWIKIEIKGSALLLLALRNDTSKRFSKLQKKKIVVEESTSKLIAKNMTETEKDDNNNV